MSSWVRGKCIGKGAFGVVNLAYSKSDSKVFAVKSVDTKTALPSQLEALENEIKILKRLSSSSCSSSPHVIGFLGEDVTCEGNKTSSFKNLHLEYMPGGTVAEINRADVDEKLVRNFAWCLVNALRDVHARGVVHCDVKGRNVLIGGSVAKLADFGSAMEFSGGECEVPRGSPMWMAPEVVRREYQGPESDVWSLGCTVIEIFTGKSPWEDRGFETLSRIGFSDELPEFPSGLSELGRDFLEKCLRRDRNRRWRCDQLLQHPFLLPCDRVVETSPRCVLDCEENEFEFEEENEVKLNSDENENSGKNRIGKLATGMRVNWETEDWIEVRAISSEQKEEATMENEEYECDCEGEEAESGVIWEIENIMRVEEEMEVGSNSEYGDSDERVKWEMWKYNRNRRNNVIGGSGSWSGWRCRYRYGWGNFNRNISGIFSICTCCNNCKLFKSCKLFSIYNNCYYSLWLKIFFNWCFKLRFMLNMVKSVFILKFSGNNLIRTILFSQILEEFVQYK
ncbi:putative mitogen-activated protein kinase kinase kinase STE-STE11 family [Medicago truncatula]|uniref:Putative mitogen-activated protein kinase kinase kinase STE-STE11 family n=1 Tax=Medicago truncatula TaxID=3880 RepID=A0A396HX67_MEDTR|nr:mitogen-activated protein kinase kinase kinase 18 [Medicago truncatula]RHN56534.1 putative mitogen-activated protein kinase kinase kinase STE-STE11 family [Medicago truncatula]